MNILILIILMKLFHVCVEIRNHCLSMAQVDFLISAIGVRVSVSVALPQLVDCVGVDRDQDQLALLARLGCDIMSADIERDGSQVRKSFGD